MRDGAVIFVVCVVLIGCVGWLILRANGISPFAPATVVVQSTDETPKEEPKPSPPEKKLIPVRTRTEIAAVVPVAEPHAVVAVSAPKPAVAPPPQMPYPSVPQIKPGFEKAHITQMYGDPSLRATTGSRGHTFDTFVYNRERGDAMTIIRFEDGRVYAARATP